MEVYGVGTYSEGVIDIYKNKEIAIRIFKNNALSDEIPEEIINEALKDFEQIGYGRCPLSHDGYIIETFDVIE